MAVQYEDQADGDEELEFGEAFEDEETDAARRMALKGKMEGLVGRLTTLAIEQTRKKSSIEDRWLEDLRQYHGRYNQKTENNLRAVDKSRLFVNMTRSKTHAWEAKLSDMLFPSDDDNWSISSTPVPELLNAISKDQPDDPDAQNINQAPSPEAQQAQTLIDEAKAASIGMGLEIKDQLASSGYELQMREVVRDAVKLGTGISKGPTLTNKPKRQWAKQQNNDGSDVLDEDGNTVQVLSATNDPRPDNQHVDAWSFFPDMSATSMRNAGFAFERHLYNAKELRALSKQPGFDLEELRELLEESPKEGYPTYVNVLRELTGNGLDSLMDRYHVWEYHGPIEREDLEAMLEHEGRSEEIEDYDPLEEINVIVWFCQNRLLKFAEQPMESGDLLYSVFAFEKDDTSIFGYGVPYVMRDAQAAINGSWRMIMENGGLSARPQIVIDSDKVEPENGSWSLVAGKVWRKLKGSSPGDRPFETFDIKNNQADLTNIIEMAIKFADMETSLPAIEQQGQGQGAGAMRTAMGMAILMNSINVVFRRVVKNFDDEMTIPNLTRMYDWNMQFSKNDAIKGDFDVVARGSSVLLVREIQAQSLMGMAMNFASHPVFGPMTKAADLYRQLVKAHTLSPADIVKTDEEIKAGTENSAPDPEIARLEAERSNLEYEWQMRDKIATYQWQGRLMELAENNKMGLEKLKELLFAGKQKTESNERIAQMKSDESERKFAAEAAMEERKDLRGDTSGSGGSLS